MSHFYLLETIASEVFNSQAMAQHRRTAQLLAALAALSLALSRRQQALAEAEEIGAIMAQTADPQLRQALNRQRQQAHRDLALAELELRGLDLWINAQSGNVMGKAQLLEAIANLSEEVAQDSFAPIFPSEAALDTLLSGCTSGPDPRPE